MRVLVIEDEQKMADLIKRGLEEEGIEVETAYDGDVGFESGKSENIDLIILDLALPGRNGLDMAREWRQMGIKTPILIVTAMDSTEAKVKGLDTGADSLQAAMVRRAAHPRVAASHGGGGYYEAAARRSDAEPDQPTRGARRQ